jgi:hypothetical protein
MHLDRSEALRRASATDHGVLATLHEPRGADLVPACFAIDGGLLAIPVDQVKPKGSTALGRLRNLERDPRATFLVEHWDAADWSALWWVRLSMVRSSEDVGTIDRLTQALRGRYPQYATAAFVELLTFRITAVAGWIAS